MTATIEVVSQKKENVLLLPEEAIISDDNQKIVMIKTTVRRPEKREIKTGLSNGKKVEIISGISDNDIAIMPSEEREKETAEESAIFGIKNSPPPPGLR